MAWRGWEALCCRHSQARSAIEMKWSTSRRRRACDDGKRNSSLALDFETRGMPIRANRGPVSSSDDAGARSANAAGGKGQSEGLARIASGRWRASTRASDDRTREREASASPACRQADDHGSWKASGFA